MHGTAEDAPVLPARFGLGLRPDRIFQGPPGGCHDDGKWQEDLGQGKSCEEWL